MRIFTPSDELPFAGHPNIGTAYVLAAEGDPAASVVFEEIAGLVPVSVQREDGRPVGAELTAPQALAIGQEWPVASIAACLTLAAVDIVTTRHPPVSASVGTWFVLVEVATRDALRRARIDTATYAREFEETPGKELYFYTCDGGGFDLHARMLWSHGEDPATGSATVTLAALLAEAGPDGETALRIEQGRDMGRPSTLLTRTIKQAGVVRSAHVGGRCVSVMRGTLDL